MAGLAFAAAQLVRFGWLQARSCTFAVAVLAGVAVAGVVPLPVHRYDALLVYCVLVAVVLRLVRWESTGDVLVILGFHVLGLVFELVKVAQGSWVYPDAALTKVVGVPLYSGFLYAAVGSYVLAAWRLFRLRLTGYRPLATALAAAALYVNLITHEWLPDLRWPLAALLVAVTWGSWAHFTVGTRRYRMPLALSFVLIGFFLWLAENAATYAGAWSYPYQLAGWQPVSPGKIGAWAMMVSVAVVLIAGWQRRPSKLVTGPDDFSG